MPKHTLAEVRKSPDLRTTIDRILSEKFIHTGAIAEILATAIYSQQNVILFGPGGHGKSEMVEAVLEGLGLWDRKDPMASQALIQSFGEGLTEDALWGGIDFPALNHPSKPDLIFNVANSFLNYPVAVFEELFDAPPFCLLPLKHTLQAGFLAKNGRSYPMQTQLIIACTNRDPEEIGDMGETYRALLERFVLRQQVVWERYDQAAYEELISKHIITFDCTATKSLFCRLIEDCHNAGHFVSPRTAMKAATILEQTAAAHGRSAVNVHDFLELKHVAGFSYTMNTFASNMQAKLNEAKAELELAKQLEAMQAHRVQYEAFLQDTSAAGKVIEWALWAKRFKMIADFINKIAVPDGLYERRNEAVRIYTDLAQHCTGAAVDAVRLPDFLKA